MFSGEIEFQGLSLSGRYFKLWLACLRFRGVIGYYREHCFRSLRGKIVCVPMYVLVVIKVLRVQWKEFICFKYWCSIGGYLDSDHFVT